MPSDDDLVAENARLTAEVERLRLKLYGPDQVEPPSGKTTKSEPAKPVLVYLQVPRDWQRPEGSPAGPGAEGMRAVTSTWVGIQTKKHPEWDVRILDEDDLERIPEGATVLRGLGGGPQWVADREDGKIKLSRVARDEERALFDRIAVFLDRMRAHLEAAQAVGDSREGQGHLLAVDLHTANLNYALALWHAGRDEDLCALLDGSDSEGMPELPSALSAGETRAGPP